MFKDIEYEKDGVKKMASERFKEDLKNAGWEVVEQKKVGRPKKENKED